MTKTPAEYVLEVLRDAMEANGWKLTANHMPDQPHKCLTIYDLQFGRMEERRHRTGEVDEHPGVQIIVRDQRHDAVQGLYDAWDILKAVYAQPLSDGKIMRCITKTNTIASLGQEPKTRRCLFSQQFRMTLE